MINKKGFTLIEMLIVIVLMGIIMTLALPSVMKLMENRSSDEYRTQLKLVEQASNLYQIRYRGEFNNNPSASCFIIKYQTLLDEKLIEEQDIKCNGIIYYKKDRKGNFSRSYFLNCRDKNNVEFSHYNEVDVPTGCINLDIDNEKEDTPSIEAPTIRGGNNNWVSTNIDITVDNSGIPLSQVKHYEYYKSTTSTTPSKYTTPTGTTSNSVTISENGTTYIWYRVVDKSGNISNWSNRQTANIDKTTPTAPVITASDNITSGNLHKKNFVLTFGGSNNVSGNSYYYGTTSNPTTMATALAITPSDNGKRIYVKSCSGANVCSTTKDYVIKIEIPPVVDPALIE